MLCMITFLLYEYGHIVLTSIRGKKSKYFGAFAICNSHSCWHACMYNKTMRIRIYICTYTWWNFSLQHTTVGGSPSRQTNKHIKRLIVFHIVICKRLKLKLKLTVNGKGLWVSFEVWYILFIANSMMKLHC